MRLLCNTHNQLRFYCFRSPCLLSRPSITIHTIQEDSVTETPHDVVLNLHDLLSFIKHKRVVKKKITVAFVRNNGRKIGMGLSTSIYHIINILSQSSSAPFCLRLHFPESPLSPHLNSLPESPTCSSSSSSVSPVLTT